MMRARLVRARDRHFRVIGLVVGAVFAMELPGRRKRSEPAGLASLISERGGGNWMGFAQPGDPVERVLYDPPITAEEENCSR